MSFTLHEVSKDDPDFSAIAPVADAGYIEPFNGMWEIWRGPSLEECTTRLALWHGHDPTSLWTYLTDNATGDIIGVMGWNLHKENPFANGVPSLTAYWMEEGGLKNISDQVIAKFCERRPEYMNKPHMLVSYCSVHPDHRHRGAASAMIKWGLQKADELGLETFVESTDHAKGFYEAHGFENIRDFSLDAEMSEPTDDFLAWKQKLLPLHGWIMSRPKQDE